MPRCRVIATTVLGLLLTLVTFSLRGTVATAQETGSSAEIAGRHVQVITYDGIINPVAAEFMTRAIRDAERDRAEALVIRLDTPGGLDTSMRLIIKEISASEVPVIVYVAPTGARAASAGVFITLAAHVAAMAPGTNIGAAHPVAMGGQMDKEMKKKVENDAAAYIRSIAAQRGRNEQWAEDAVRNSVSVTEKDAVRLKVVDLTAESLDTLFAAVDGRTVTTTGKRVLHMKGADVKQIEMGFRFRLLRALSDPNIAFVLMSLGMAGLFFELSNPGLILPGVVGTIALILALYSFQTLPINYAGLALILLGVILFIAEIKVTSYGLLTVGGIIAMLLGSLMLIDTTVPFLRLSWSVVIPTVLTMSLFFVATVTLAVRAHRLRPISGREGLIGMVGVATTDLTPGGTVIVHGELWDAESPEPLRQGDAVEVVSVENLRLRVKRH